MLQAVAGVVGRACRLASCAVVSSKACNHANINLMLSRPHVVPLVCLSQLPVDLSNVESAAICGIGNVALDCARILLKGSEGLTASDAAAHALEALKAVAGKVKDVHLVARRGPVQVRGRFIRGVRRAGGGDTTRYALRHGHQAVGCGDGASGMW